MIQLDTSWLQHVQKPARYTGGEYNSIALPTGFVNKLGVQQTKVYVSLENIWTYTLFYKHIKQFDVESINSKDFETVELIKQGMYSFPIIENGGRPYSYPIMKSMTLGLSLTF